jgi:hypothetical protein
VLLILKKLEAIAGEIPVAVKLIIEADTPAELKSTLLDMAGVFGGGEGEAGEAPAEAPKGRGRRTTAASATAASGAQSQAETPAAPASSGSASGQTATTAASPSEPSADDILGIGATTAPAAAPATVTKEMLAAKMGEAMQATSPLKLQEALKGAGLGARLSEIAEGDYTKAYEVCSGLIA